MSRTRNFVLPPSILDLAFTLMIVVLLALCMSLNNIRQEYKTKVKLVEKRSQRMESGVGPETLSLSISKNNDSSYRLVLESKKLGVKEYPAMADVLDELLRLHPMELVLRVDQDARFAIPQEVMIFAHENKINLGFSYHAKGGKA